MFLRASSTSHNHLVLSNTEKTCWGGEHSGNAFAVACLLCSGKLISPRNIKEGKGYCRAHVATFILDTCVLLKEQTGKAEGGHDGCVWNSALVDDYNDKALRARRDYYCMYEISNHPKAVSKHTTECATGVFISAWVWHRMRSGWREAILINWDWDVHKVLSGIKETAGVFKDSLVDPYSYFKAEFKY